MSQLGFSDVLIPSYIRQLTATLKVTASDMAYAISSILEQKSDKELCQTMQDNFWQAYESLDLKNAASHI